jgi:hypothetical protein|tara:strand:+ start:335 stop:565 length:231 start_codon:yes stop_codon:yes gene_type:complete
MSYQNLSEQYALCCEEIQRLTTMLYEHLHNEDGTPDADWEAVIDKVKSYRKGIRAETDAIIDVCREYHENKMSSGG